MQLVLWIDVDNRRRFFLNYAHDHGFEPLVAENWYSQSNKNIFSAKVWKETKETK